jgi:membrane-associated phospholipid phosphatase
MLLIGFTIIYEITKVGKWDPKLMVVLLLLCMDAYKDQTDRTWLQFLPGGLVLLFIPFIIYYKADAYWWKVADWQMTAIRHIWNWDAAFSRIPLNDPGWIHALLPSQWLTDKLSWVYNYGFPFAVFGATIRSFLTKDWKKVLQYPLAGHILQTPLIIPFYNTIELHEVWWVKKLPDLLGRTVWMDAYHLQLNAQNCFPSMHTSVGFAVMLLALREKGPVFKWGMVAYTGTLIFSTLYLRIHWTIDVLAGLLFGYLVVKLTDWLFAKVSPPAWLKRRQAPAG